MKTLPVRLALIWTCFCCAGVATTDVRNVQAALNDARSFAQLGWLPKSTTEAAPFTPSLAAFCTLSRHITHNPG
jgi:hypothetical protein